MTGDDRWVLPIVVAILAIWYPCLIGLYHICTDLYTREKLSARPWKALTAVFVVALAGPIAAAFVLFLYLQRVFTGVVSVLMMGAFACVLYWQRGRVATIWRHVGPVLIVLLTLGPLFVAAIHTREAVVGLLAVIPPLFASYLLRRDLSQLASAATTLLAAAARAIQRRRKVHRWQYDFIEHLYDETTEILTHGDIVERIRNAKSGGVLADAILEHPPGQNDTIIRYLITVDEAVDMLRVEGSYGILEQYEDEEGNLQVSSFPSNTGNRVNFEVWANQRMIFQDDKEAFGWSPIHHEQTLRPVEGRLTIEFRTNAMDDPHFNWAAWSHLKLVECT